MARDLGFGQAISETYEFRLLFLVETRYMYMHVDNTRKYQISDHFSHFTHLLPTFYTTISDSPVHFIITRLGH